MISTGVLIHPKQRRGIGAEIGRAPHGSRRDDSRSVWINNSQYICGIHPIKCRWYRVVMCHGSLRYDAFNRHRKYLGCSWWDFFCTVVSSSRWPSKTIATVTTFRFCGHNILSRNYRNDICLKEIFSSRTEKEIANNWPCTPCVLQMSYFSKQRSFKNIRHVSDSYLLFSLRRGCDYFDCNH